MVDILAATKLDTESEPPNCENIVSKKNKKTNKQDWIDELSGIILFYFIIVVCLKKQATNTADL